MSLFRDFQRPSPGSVALITAIWLALMPVAVSAVESPDDLTVRRDGDRITVDARNAALGEILSAIQAAFPVTVTGLSDRADEEITFSVSGDLPEETFKRLLRQLGETNYAFEFIGRQLSRVSVLPPAAAGAAPPPRPDPARPAPPDREEMVEVVRVNRVIEDSQAESLDIRTGDLIVEYDGEPIQEPADLIRAVKALADRNQVQMLVVRDGTPIPYELKGGFIGVQIVSTRIPREQFERFR